MGKGDKAKEQKAGAAAEKAAAAARSAAAAEDAAWQDGANSKAAAKKAADASAAAERARAKAAADAQLREEADAAAKQKLRGAEKVAARKTAKTEAVSEEASHVASPALVGRGIDAALAVMSIATEGGDGGGDEAAGGGGGGSSGSGVDRDNARVQRIVAAGVAGLKEDDKHPEKRMKAAYARYKERELPLLKAEYPSLRMTQHLEVRLASLLLRAPHHKLKNQHTQFYINLAADA